MSRDKKKLPWRCRNVKQAKDKAEIYNSREWQQLRISKIQSVNGLCEVCMKQGYIVPTNIVHHIHPIEDSHSMQEMRYWAFKWDNLLLVCRQCHAKIHKEIGSQTKEVVKERRQQRHDRWVDAMKAKFRNNNNNGIQDTTGAATVDARTED